MTIIEKDFSEYLDEQREKYEIRGCHFRRISDIVQTACIYSRFDGEGMTVPNYYIVIYCVGLFVKHFLPRGATVRIFDETVNATEQFRKAYKELCEGQSFRDAVNKMKVAMDSDSLEAIDIYRELLIRANSTDSSDEIERCKKKLGNLEFLLGAMT